MICSVIVLYWNTLCNKTSKFGKKFKIQYELVQDHNEIQINQNRAKLFNQSEGTTQNQAEMYIEVTNDFELFREIKEIVLTYVILLISVITMPFLTQLQCR